MVNIHKNFLTESECTALLKVAIDKFEIDRRTYSGWSCRVNRSLEFENRIKNILTNISPYESFHISWINLTEYKQGSSLELHKDERSNFTFTIPLTSKYQGGDFLIEGSIYKLNLGDCIAFTGGELEHGVTEVRDGYRASLNIWIKQGNKKVI